MNKWEKQKKKEKYYPIEIDEILVLIIGIMIFLIPCFSEYRFYFIIGVIVWYWGKVKYFEIKILKKNQEIYNVYYEQCQPIPQKVIDGQTEKARKPMYYDLQQLEKKREFLIGKFVVINLILMILIQSFLK